MENFTYCTPTKLIFGKGAVDKLAAELAPFGKRVLLTYGGGSIKCIGLYRMRFCGSLTALRWSSCPALSRTPNIPPAFWRACGSGKRTISTSCWRSAAAACSTAPKPISRAGALYDGEPWDLITYRVKAKAALPLVDILTLAATGSEYDSGCVMSRTETNDKVGYL